MTSVEDKRREACCRLDFIRKISKKTLRCRDE